MEICIFLSREHNHFSPSFDFQTLEDASRGETAIRRSAGGDDGAREADITDTKLAARSLTLESGGRREMRAVKLRNASKKKARLALDFRRGDDADHRRFGP
jgi:hypothetical protein